jgi:hypothetical protein
LIRGRRFIRNYPLLGLSAEIASHDRAFEVLRLASFALGSTMARRPCEVLENRRLRAAR